MRRKIVAGNWKMNGSKTSIKALVANIQNLNSADDVDVIVFPPFVYLECVAKSLEDSHIHLGAQNVNGFEEGAHTGEVSASMLKDIGCSYVLIGHSERRTLYADNADVLGDKLTQAINCALKPIFCVGEKEIDRKEGQTPSVIQEQLSVLLSLPKELLAKCIIAYEPVWAIGTGLSASPDEAQEVHAFIREELAKCDSTLALNMPILYGGSVNAKNANSLFEMSDIDGGLVGGASLKSEEFMEIVKCIK